MRERTRVEYELVDANPLNIRGAPQSYLTVDEAEAVRDRYERDWAEKSITSRLWAWLTRQTPRWLINPWVHTWTPDEEQEAEDRARLESLTEEIRALQAQGKLPKKPTDAQRLDFGRAQAALAQLDSPSTMCASCGKPREDLRYTRCWNCRPL